MREIDRRGFARAILFGTAAAGLGLAPAAAMPLDERVPADLDNWIENIQWGPHPRRRRQVRRCWWHRGRRVCRWVWV